MLRNIYFLLKRSPIKSIISRYHFSIEICKNCNYITKCWSCSQLMTSCHAFCEKCHKIQPPPESDFCNDFELFSIKPQFDIDIKQLDQNYRGLQKKLHPDLYHNKTKEELSFSSSYSEKLNMAYSKLKHATSRALELYGVKDVLDEKSTIPNNELLMEIFELKSREKIAEADQNELRKMLNANNKETNTCLKQILELFRKNDIKNAKQVVIRLQFLTKIQEDIMNKIEL